ncbi:hypothetical protein [Macrococcus carouselicus]|uniref:Uncharacterized protein n=1 Tax=Macrococcus carouselicus TaxID=69969 RepID=A0A9Q8FQQ2_9STAP|nr:hypothetical protein [Macrococcus carouselicus]TDM02220.1 hypothetical protein ERX40_06605 [Macrococcus carouselicus]
MKGLVVLIILLIFITGCSQHKEHAKVQKQQEEVTTEQTEKAEKTPAVNRALTVEDLFIQPHFVIKDFNVKTANNNVQYIIKYVIDPSANNYIEKHHPVLYLNILYPDEILKSSHKSTSKTLKLTPTAGDVLDKEMIINDTFKPEFNVNTLTASSHQLQLQIFKENKQLIHVFENLNDYRRH